MEAPPLLRGSDLPQRPSTAGRLQQNENEQKHGWPERLARHELLRSTPLSFPTTTRRCYRERLHTHGIVTPTNARMVQVQPSSSQHGSMQKKP
jgi:hypothetical protein